MFVLRECSGKRNSILKYWLVLPVACKKKRVGGIMKRSKSTKCSQLKWARREKMARNLDYTPDGVKNI